MHPWLAQLLVETVASGGETPSDATEERGLYRLRTGGHLSRGGLGHQPSAARWAATEPCTSWRATKSHEPRWRCFRVQVRPVWRCTWLQAPVSASWSSMDVLWTSGRSSGDVAAGVSMAVTVGAVRWYMQDLLSIVRRGRRREPSAAVVAGVEEAVCLSGGQAQ